MNVIKTLYPKARKQHKCDLCGCPIEIGQQYERQTIEDGELYEYKCHTECVDAISVLDMSRDCWDDGISQTYFKDFVDDYIYEEHYDNSIDDIAKEWQDLTLYEKVKMILDELKTEKK